MVFPLDFHSLSLQKRLRSGDMVVFASLHDRGCFLDRKHTDTEEVGHDVHIRHGHMTLHSAACIYMLPRM